MTRRIGATKRRRNLPIAFSLLVSVFLLLVLSSAAGQRGAMAVSSPPPAADAAASFQDAAAGASLFQTQCAACHSIGGGDGVGPDLQGVTTQRETDWLSRWILDPAAMIAAGDPIAGEMLPRFNNLAMPTLGLSEAEVASIIAYLTEQDGGTAAVAPQPVTPQPISAAPGDGSVAAGKNLFTGTTRLSNGGPSCRACHSIAGIGGLGGGKLGLDLTGSYARLGDAMILWPETSKTMVPIFTSKPLTAQEKTDLLAFFSSTDLTSRSANKIWELVGLAVAGVAVMAVLAQLIWRDRLRGVRIPMVSRARDR